VAKTSDLRPVLAGGFEGEELMVNSRKKTIVRRTDERHPTGFRDDEA
jgi:hypothetical protein